MTSEGPIAGATEGDIFSASVPASRLAGHYTARVRAWHEEAFLPAESAWIAWQRYERAQCYAHNERRPKRADALAR